MTTGGKPTAEYQIWSSMKSRVLNPRNKAFINYGGRGITIDPTWEKSFSAFYKDMGPRPTAHHSIERKDNSQGYCKENCEWVEKTTQANNTRTNHRETFQGKTQTVMQWANEKGIPYGCLLQRLNRRGWNIEKALTTPTKPRERILVFHGKSMNLKEWASTLGINKSTLWNRLRYNWPLKKALTP